MKAIEVGDVKYWVGLNTVSGIGPVRFKRLLEHFQDAGSAWQASQSELQAAGLDSRSIEALLATRRSLSLDSEVARLAQEGATVLTWEDEGYPSRLRQIHSSPPLLYVRGEIRPQDEWAVAVVGTRAATRYGRQMVEEIAGDLARSGITVVSGLARGIDSLAHRAALRAGGRTIAVLGSGIDIIYPHEHRDLAGKIVERGALITEYPLGTKPEAGNFPPRNRIISGLSLGTLVVEAGKRSGALITADYALEQGREVFALPGSVNSRKSEGTNRLIQEGAAKLVMSVEDILEELNLTMVERHQEVRAAVPADEREARILEHVSSQPLHVDEIGQRANLPISEVTSTLAMMELKGMVRQVGGMNYVVARERGVQYAVD
ncbi:MAG TPA: DNA-processing protein DprA [Anaerolineae bacterium]|nr:DNA-processing protein DprA [Anaerolineae bacterium]